MNFVMHLTLSLEKAASEHPNRLATICGDHRTTYLQFRDRARRLAGGLRATGVAPGGRVAILGLDSDRYLEFYYAAWYAGAIIAPVNHRWSVDEIAFSLVDCGAEILILDDHFVGLATALSAKAPNLKTLVYMGEAAPSAGGRTYDDLAAYAAMEAPPLDDASAAVLFYTGGTTGRSKGVLLSHRGLFLTALSSLPLNQRLFGAVCLHGLPLFHAGGLFVTLQAIACQSTFVSLPAFDPVHLLDLVEREAISEIALVPTMIRRLLDEPKFDRDRMATVKRIYYGASPIDGSLLARLADLLPNALLGQQYGMTETGGIVATLPDWCHRASAREKGYHRGAGVTTPAAQIAIMSNAGEALLVGGIGEICVRGPGVMMEYWGLPELTAQALRDGWMHTGDMGYFDKAGILYVVDRLKDMIVSGGENIYSAEVEDVILSMPQVSQCAVIAVPDPNWGERVHAVIVLVAGAELSAQEVIAFCKSRIAGYKCARSVEFREDMPISGAGKLLKYKLREPYWSDRSRGVA